MEFLGKVPFCLIWAWAVIFKTLARPVRIEELVWSVTQQVSLATYSLHYKRREMATVGRSAEREEEDEQGRGIRWRLYNSQTSHSSW